MELLSKSQKHSKHPKLYLQLILYQEGSGEIYRIKKLPIDEALKNLHEIIDMKTGEKYD